MNLFSLLNLFFDFFNECLAGGFGNFFLTPFFDE